MHFDTSTGKTKYSKNDLSGFSIIELIKELKRRGCKLIIF